MHKNLVSQCENVDLKKFEGRVLTLLGEILQKLDSFSSEDEFENDSQETAESGNSNSEWQDG